jgi:hypothetical protein
VIIPASAGMTVNTGYLRNLLGCDPVIENPDWGSNRKGKSKNLPIQAES